MRKYPTPWQYLVDLVGQGRLKAAYASGDAKQRAEAEKNFRGLTEDEVVFEKLVDRKDGKLGYSLTCKVRGFKIKELTFATGSLAKMIQQNANLMVQHEDLATSQITGFYFCEDADQLHLLVHPNSNIHEALKMTGYEFQPEHYSATMYAGRDEILQADGVVSIEHPVIAGQIYISYVQPTGSAEQELENAGFGDFGKRDGLESLQINNAPYSETAPVTDLTKGGQIGAVGEPTAPAAEDKVVIPSVVNPVIVKEDETAVESETANEQPAEETPAEEPVVQIQKKKK